VSAILVTGGAGFIGSHLVDALVAEGHEVTVVDNLHPAAHRTKPDYLNADARYVWGDLRDLELVERTARGVDAVSHQAGMVGLGTNFADVAEFVDHNDAGTAALLLALHRTKFRGRLVLGSSMVVYGEGRYRCPRHGMVRPGPRSSEDLRLGAFEPRCTSCGRDLVPQPIPESTPADPRTVYAATKLHQEHLCAVYSREEGASGVMLRYHNVYGPRMPRDTPYAGIAAIFRSALEGGQPPRVFEDGRQLRDFVHVKDVARAGVLALQPETSPGVYNVASGEPHTVLQMARALAEAFGPAAPDPEVTGAYRLGDVRHVFVSVDRAREVLGFRADVRFGPGMADLAGAPLRQELPAIRPIRRAGAPAG
jgi:dTDP-L-rhamnose 4-epimerase